MNPRVKKVKPEQNFKLRISFDNGEVRIFDMSPHLDLGIFKELKNTTYFRHVKPRYGTIAWPHGQDICPDTLYQESIVTKGVHKSTKK
ncbi:MAG: DUF2442 domain-containing protein [bacterium]